MIYTLQIGDNNADYRGWILVVDDEISTVCAVETWCKMVGLPYKRNSLGGVNTLVGIMRTCLDSKCQVLLDYHLGLANTNGEEITGLSIACKYFAGSDLEKIVIVTSDPCEVEIESQKSTNADKIRVEPKTSLYVLLKELLKEYFCIEQKKTSSCSVADTQ